MSQTDFWDDHDKAQHIINELNELKENDTLFETMGRRVDDAEVMYALVKEENDAELLSDLVSSIAQLENQVKDFELHLLLNEPYDKGNAILELHPGARGTESQDWASILLRMYQRWADSKGFSDRKSVV